MGIFSVHSIVSKNARLMRHHFECVDFFISIEKDCLVLLSRKR